MIWLVDDDNEDLEFFQDALQRNGYTGETRYIDSGTHLMDLLTTLPREELPSVIVLDLNMHSKSGFETLADIKSNPRLCGIPVMILSGSTDREDEGRCMALGCERYWVKPGSMHEYDVMANYLIKLF